MADYIADQVRREDRDRFLCALFAPEGERADLLALYAFNGEVAKIRDSVSEVMIGLIKLQWWRDLIAEIYAPDSVSGDSQKGVGNPVAVALTTAIARRGLSRAHFDALLDARARDLDDAPLSDIADLEAYAEGTSARVTWLALEALGVRDAASVAAGRHVGIAWALTGILRAVLFHARANRFLLPAGVMASAGLTGHDLGEQRNRTKVAGVVEEIARLATAHLERARLQQGAIDVRAVPALLPATLATGYLRGLKRRQFDVFDPRHGLQRPNILALVWSALRKRY